MRNRSDCFLLRLWQGRRRDQIASVCRVIRVMQSQPAIHHCLPRINARAVGSVVIRLQAFSGQQFGVRNEEVQLHTPFVGVFNPQHAVLVFIESGHQNPLETLHQLFTLSGRQVNLSKRQHPGSVFFGIR
ncbi:hypothetical protein [Citrobacter meridianamericanus]|uniref:hypothetical protein n=1 Tax=Citrobacter meridianamericanus TaxID=2894201 RepID=UPI0039C498FA